MARDIEDRGTRGYGNPTNFNINKVTEEQKTSANEKVIMEGGSSTDPANRFKGETATQANARITEAYKNLTAKPILSEEQIAAGAKVQWVRTGAGGKGEWTVVVPPGYKGERTITKWTDGIIPGGSKYTTGSTVGKKISGGKVVGGGSKPTITTTSEGSGKSGITGSITTPKTITDVLGSDLEKFRIDPATGKQRTSQEIVNAAIAEALKLPDSAWGSTTDAKTGKTISTWTQAQKINAIVQQLSANATRNAPNRQFSKDVANYIGSNYDAVTRNYLQNDKTSWKYQPGFIEPTAGEAGKVVLDLNKTSLTPEEIAKYRGQPVNFIDPVTGNIVDVDINTGAIKWGDLKERIDSSNNKNDGTDSTDGTDGTDGNDGIGDGNGNGDNNGTGDNNFKTQNANISIETRDAFAILESTFRAYGLEELVNQIKDYMERGLGSEQASLELKNSQVYKDRFRGNELRRAAGLNVISEAEYLNLENSYNETLRSYGLQGYFGLDKKAARLKMADIIGNDIAATEFKDRIDTVVTRVNNADPLIKSTLKSFYNINDTDLIGYFLNPKENMPKLQEKVTAAEIGSAAIGQGLISNVTSAEALAKLGITRGKAVEGYGIIAETLPTSEKLSKIYGEEGITYTQTTAEEEVFKGLASAERKRKQLASREFAAFGGGSGVGKTSLGRSNASGAF
jgi:hypothetical protein